MLLGLLASQAVSCVGPVPFLFVGKLSCEQRVLLCVDRGTVCGSVVVSAAAALVFISVHVGESRQAEMFV